jgi:hypothetical protein
MFVVTKNAILISELHCLSKWALPKSDLLMEKLLTEKPIETSLFPRMCLNAL